ncbi:response regulator [Isoalcanivorax beigongshangi]|uniref:Response regulator n=1 Tax=Isoalcanivorax beigongshangi TaxID=3238810 RepID=A0ABV4AH06_9GAMM
MKKKIVFADDHPLVLAGLSDMFDRDFVFDVVGTATTPSELVALVQAQQPDIAITDFSMPGDEQYGDGLKFIDYLIRHFPDTKVLVVTMVSNPMILESLYQAGVAGVVLKSDNMNALPTALQRISLGHTYTHPSLQQAPRASHREDPVTTLSPREMEVLRLFVGGQSLKQVAGELHRSIKTVSNQKRSAMRKLNLDTDQELISFCLRRELFS